MKYHSFVKSLIVKPTKERIFSELATIISIEEEAAGLFVIVEQHGRTDIGKISITSEEWPLICDAIEKLLSIAVVKDINGAT